MSVMLYDVPGPRTRRRIRIASIVAGVLLTALLAIVLKRFADKGQFDAARWKPFTQWGVVKFLMLGLWMTVRCALAAMVFSCLLGTVMAFGRLSRSAVVRVPAVAYVQFFRAIPLLVLILFSALGLPKYHLDFPLPIYLVIGLTLYNSAVIAEIVRAGILSIDRGQTEAALSVGLTDRQAMRLVVLPQAVRRMLPALVTQLVTILKDTSLGSVISVEELLRRSGSVSDFFPGTVLSSTLVVCAIYIVVCLALTRLATRLNRRQESRLGAGAATAAVNEDQALLQARGTTR